MQYMCRHSDINSCQQQPAILSSYNKTLSIFGPQIGHDANMRLQYVPESSKFIKKIFLLHSGFNYIVTTIYIVRVFRMDYVGILLLLVTSFLPWLHYGFYCHNGIQAIYIALIAVLGVLCIFAVLHDQFNKSNMKPLRAGREEADGVTG